MNEKVKAFLAEYRKPGYVSLAEAARKAGISEIEARRFLRKLSAQ